MAKEATELINNILKMEGVRHCAAVSKEDGSSIAASPGTPGNFGEVVAFLGSAAEVITTNLDLGGLNSLLAEGQGHQMLIVPHEQAYLGVEFNEGAVPWWAHQHNPLELFSEGRMAEISEAEELIRQKVNLLNLLLEAFGAKGDKAAEWSQMLEAEIKNVDPSGRLAKVLDAGPGFVDIKIGAKTDLTKKEVGDAFEKLVNLTCKKAIATLGFVEVKQKFQAVISKLAAEKR